MPRWILFFSFVLAVLVFPAIRAGATEQEEDVIRYNGKVAHLLELPLNSHLLTLNPIPRFDRSRTSNWKGYTAEWEIRDGKLYLIAFEGTVDRKLMPIAQLFPKRNLPILADWFTGTLHLLSSERERVKDYPVFKHVTQMRVTKGVVSDPKEMHDVKITSLKAGDGPSQ